jgi:acyl-coenzyme A synthetase/AMP-(fatty) acid ligase
MEDRPTDFETEPTASSDTATILYTSGTTGPPKGVKHAHDTVLGLLPSYVTSVCDNKIGHNVVRGPAELSWTGTLYNALLPSFYYGTSYVIDAHPQYDPERELETVDMFDITTLGGPATAFRMMMQIDDVEGRYDLSSTDVVLAGAESLGQSIVDWMKETMGDVAVHDLYGQTEAPLVVADVEALGVEAPVPDEQVEGGVGQPVLAGEADQVAARVLHPVDVVVVRQRRDRVRLERYASFSRDAIERYRDTGLVRNLTIVRCECSLILLVIVRRDHQRAIHPGLRGEVGLLPGLDESGVSGPGEHRNRCLVDDGLDDSRPFL